MDKEVILELKHINKTFVTTKAVVDMSLAFYRGEIHAIIGENGSGKSTLASMIAGVQKPDSGEMILKRQPYAPQDTVDGKKHKICMLLQERGTVRNMSVAENIFLGREDEICNRFGLVSRKLGIQKAGAILDAIDRSDIDPAASINDLTFEDAKLIEFGMALKDDPEILILDETSTSLSQKGRNTMYRLMAELKARGKTIILISHDFEEVVKLSDRVTVMRDGNFIKTLEADEIEERVLKTLLVGREFTEKYYRTDTEMSMCDEVVLKIRDICFGKLLKNVSFDLHRGEILGIGGLSECGMHELMKIVFGLLNADSGTVTHVSSGEQIKNTVSAVKHGIGYLPKNREAEGLMMGASVKDNLNMMSYDLLKKGIYIGNRAEINHANAQVSSLQIKAQSLEQSVVYLSGGNKQKVVIGKCLGNNTDIWLMDCPTRGIDVGVKATIYRLMEQFKEDGKAVLMVTEEMPELIGMSDRVIVLKDGEIAGEFKRSSSLSETDIIQCMI